VKKLCTILVALALIAQCFALLPVQAQAADVADLTFTLNADGKTYSVTDCKETAAGKLAIPDTYEGKSVTAIGNAAFRNCASLTEIVIPESVQTIGSAAFSYCTKLVSVNIPAGVPDIGSDTFYKCSALAAITIPNSVTSIAPYAFYYCTSLTDISIPESVYNIGEYAFACCTSLKSVDMKAKLTKISDGLFYVCKELRSIDIPYGVTTIGEKAFYNCLLLFSASIPDTVTSIGASAFDRFDFLQFVYYCGTDAQWSAITMAEGNENLNKAERSLHKFLGGDCETAQTCAICGETGPNGHKWVAATCTGAQYCSVCEVVVRPALGHSWVEATCAAPKHCSVCDLTEGETLPHTYDNDKDVLCNVCGYDRTLRADDLIFLQAPSLSFQDYIGMQLLANGALANTYDELYVEAVQIDPVKGATTTKLTGMPYYGVYLLFDQQILSWSMAEEVTLTMYGVKDGVVYVGQSYTASVESLALSMLPKNASNAKVCRILVDMLNYGAAVQTTFNHNADYLPNTNLGEYANMGTATDPEMSATNSFSGDAFQLMVDAISMQSRVEFQLMVKYDVLEMYKPVAIANGEEVAIERKELDSSAVYIVLRIPVSAANMRENHAVTFYDRQGNAVKVCNLSVEAYAKGQVGGTYNDVVIAMMRYGDAVAVFANS